MKLQSHKIDFLYGSYIILSDIYVVNIHIHVRVTLYKETFSGINNMFFDVLRMLIYLNNNGKGNFVLSYIFHDTLKHNKSHKDPDISLRS